MEEVVCVRINVGRAWMDGWMEINIHASMTPHVCETYIYTHLPARTLTHSGMTWDGMGWAFGGRGGSFFLLLFLMV